MKEAKDRPNCSMERGLDTKSLAEDINSCWERESQFCLRILSLVSQSCSSGRPRIKEYLSSTDWSWFQSKKTEIWLGVGGILVELEVNMMKTCCTKFLMN